MPELPDLAVVADAFHAALAGRTIARPRHQPARRARHAGRARGLVGQRIGRPRRGKFLDLELERDRIVVNPMLTGRFQLAAPGEKAPAGPRS